MYPKKQLDATLCIIFGISVLSTVLLLAYNYVDIIRYSQLRVYEALNIDVFSVFRTILHLAICGLLIYVAANRKFFALPSSRYAAFIVGIISLFSMLNYLAFLIFDSAINLGNGLWFAINTICAIAYIVMFLGLTTSNAIKALACVACLLDFITTIAQLGLITVQQHGFSEAYDFLNTYNILYTVIQAIRMILLLVALILAAQSMSSQPKPYPNIPNSPLS
jgi:hypothetical protein